MVLGIRHIVRGIVAGCFLLVMSCAGGTSGEEDNDRFEGTGFDPDAAGVIDLSVRSTSIPVAGTSSFSVKVTDASGAAAPRQTISCDSEAGLAIIEPTTGSETTDIYGSMSGVVGCVFPGSFQLACRLPVGGGKRDFQTIKCTGSVPTGFDGFPGAAGGGLGGGVDTDDEDARITSLTALGLGDATSQIDTVFDSDCDNDSVADDPEPFTDDSIEIDITNNSSSAITFTSLRYSVAGGGPGGSGTATSSRIATQCEVDPNGGEGTCTALFIQAIGGGKRFVGSSTNIDFSGFKNVTVTLSGVNDLGESVSISASFALAFGNYNLCE